MGDREWEREKDWEWEGPEENKSLWERNKGRRKMKVDEYKTQ